MPFVALDPFVESRVDAYEAALIAAPQTDLREFLPPLNHEKYLAVLLELLRVDLDLAWSRGERRFVTDYQELFPSVFQHPEALQQILFEEFRLRREAGERPDPDHYQRHYGIHTDHWPAIDADTEPVIGDVTRAHAEDSWAELATPAVGTNWHGFQIVELLGSGTFGTTFQATQSALANRDVVLKFSQLNQREAWRLAQLQHTHIVPVFSVHEYGDHCAICMPYLGRRTLADVLAAEQPTNDTPCERILSVLQLTLRLADALQHSHCRGILHGDVKPANILVTEDQQPLLFDFNLAVDTNLPPTGKIRGGTLAYMAPEQLQCWLGEDVVVDHRADIYSLGVVLYQLLTHRLPWQLQIKCDERALLTERWQPPPAASVLNSSVSPAVDAILAKCLAGNPADRYQSAAELHDDLRRHLDDLPLAVAQNTSLRELGSKWMRRHPRLASASTVGLLATLVCGAILAGWLFREVRHRPIAAAQSLHEFTTAWDQLRADFVVASFLPRWSDEVTTQAEQMISRYALDDPQQVGRTLRYLNDTQRAEWCQNASSLAYMLSNARYFDAVRHSDRHLRLQQLKSALAYNHLATELATGEAASRALQHRRQQIEDALSSSEGGVTSATLAKSDVRLPPLLPKEDKSSAALGNIASANESQNWYDLLFLGLQARDDNQLSACEQYFRQAVHLKPNDATGWLLLGDVLHRQRRHEQAAAAFDAASSLTRDDTAAIFQRGLCWLACDRLDQAIADFTVVIERRPDLESARLNRALAHMAGEQYDLAFKDLTAVLVDGCTESRAYFLRARVQQKLGDALAAQADLQDGLRQTPSDAISWIARGVARMKNDPHGALTDFESALNLDPSAAEARHNQAHVYAEILDQPQRAIEALSECLRQNTDDTMALAGRGVLLARMGRTDLALQDAERLQGLPLEAITRYQLACIYALCTPDDSTLKARAVSLLAASLREDPELANLVNRDPDLNALHETTEYHDIISAVSVLRERESEGQLPRKQGESN